MSSEVEVEYFLVFRADWSSNITGKTLGGGICLLLRNKCCQAVGVREHLNTPDIELLCVSLLREIPQIFFTVVYVHPKANFNTALEILLNNSQKLESLSPDAPKYIV